jgi:hypothetical protein
MKRGESLEDFLGGSNSSVDSIDLSVEEVALESARKRRCCTIMEIFCNYN